MKRALAVLFAGLLVISACSKSDDNSDGEKPTTTISEEDAAIALADWLEQADAICEAGNEANDEIGEVQSMDDLVELGPDLLAAAQDQYDELADLPLPDEQADDVESALDLLDEQLGVLEEIVDAGDDEAAVEELVDEGNQLEDDLDELAADLGLEVCGAGDEETSTPSETDSTDLNPNTEDGLSELLAIGLGELGLTAEESSCVSDGMLAEYSATELAELDPDDPAVQSVIIEILFTCVTPERIVELNLQ